MPPEIEFTGERFVPGIAGEIEYEHVHRYAFAAREVAGRRVLDAACGEGYGSALLARTAVTVAAVDIDAATLGHAATRYRAIGNLAFHRASVAALPFGDGSFDVVVSFETIEHLEAADQPRMLAEFARVLAPGGLLILSAPNRPEYSDKRGHTNPFHRHEHDRGELDALLATHFAARRYYAQRVWLGSLLWREEGGDAFVAETGDALGVSTATVPPAMYFLVVAARAAGDLPRDRLGLSLFADVGQQELARLNALLEERLGALGKSDVHVRHLESLVAQRESLVVERDGQLGAQHARIVQFERQEQEHFARLAESDRHAASLRASLDESQASLREAQAALAAQERIIDYRQSLRWWVMLPWLRLRSWWRGRGA
ncbi:MAG TPA: class I SAM-dependent methyltransferase [Casimicrobiaceae bacterium]